MKKRRAWVRVEALKLPFFRKVECVLCKFVHGKGFVPVVDEKVGVISHVFRQVGEAFEFGAEDGTYLIAYKVPRLLIFDGRSSISIKYRGKNVDSIEMNPVFSTPLGYYKLKVTMRW